MNCLSKRFLYNKYKNKGFEIYQVSLDDDIHFWKCSCENIPWICVHETNGTAVNLYKVTKLPTYFLINRSNELVKRSDDVKTSLEDEIKKPDLITYFILSLIILEIHHYTNYLHKPHHQ